uniref:VWFA domain-containing protein n=1 Tax=Ciona intestinalis TaxID=7719 RepID=H2XVX3_CIOIN
MSLPSVIGIILVTVVTVGGDFASVTLVNNGYDGIVVAINPAVAEDETLINKIRNMFTRASPTLFTATKKRAYFRNINILVPKTWTSGSYQTAVGLTYRKADVIIAPPNPVRGDNPYVLQTGACGEPGTHMHLTPEWVNDTRESVYGPSDKAIVHEWAHLRWGVFDEYATGDHKRHYLDSNNVLQGTRCPLSIRGVNREYVPPYQVLNQTCIINQTTLLPASDTCHFIPGIEQPRGLKTSMMFYSYLSSVIEFCHSDPSDPVNQHNTEADNEQNAKCNLRSTWDVITSTSDFSGGSNPPNPTLTNLAPTFRVVRVAASRRFVLVLDVSGSMSGNRLLMMRQSAGDFISTSLPDGDKVGIVQFHSSANLMMEIRQISSQLDRVAIAAGIPGIAGGSTCIGCGIYAAMNEMERHDANETCGNIIVLTDGKENQPPYVNDVSQLAIQKNCVVNAILFTTTENSALVDLVTATGGQWFFAQDRDLKRLMGSFAVIAANDDGDVRNLVSTVSDCLVTIKLYLRHSVIIDSTVGINTTFKFSYQSQVPTIVLTNPTGCLHYSLSIPLPGTCASHPLANIDTTLKFVEFVIPGRATIGTWNYSITSMYSDTVSVSVTSKTMGNVQPIVVLTRTRSNSNIVLGPVIIEATVTRGDPGLPVLNLTVVAVIETPESTEERLQLLDNGGSPDMVRNDGVYSAMFFNYTSRGRYSIQVEVNGSLSNSGDTTFTSKAPLIFGVRFPNGTVAGNPEAGESQPSTGGTGGGGGFTRVTTGGAIEFAGEVTPPEFDTLAPIQINDLTATQEDPNDVTSGIRLSFTAPGDDMASGRATSYKVCYTFGDPTHLSTNFDGNICHTPPVQPQVANTRESFIIKSPDTTGMTGSIRMAIAVKALDEMGNESPVSNLVILRFFI